MWQGYKRRPDSYRKREVAPYVSINRRGEIVLNEAAMRLAYASWEITLFYDAETNRLGIRGGRGGDPSLHVFRARRYGRGGRLRVVRAGRLLKQFGIAITETLVFRPTQTEPGPMIVLDLD